LSTSTNQTFQMIHTLNQTEAQKITCLEPQVKVEPIIFPPMNLFPFQKQMLMNDSWLTSLQLPHEIQTLPVQVVKTQIQSVNKVEKGYVNIKKSAEVQNFMKPIKKPQKKMKSQCKFSLFNFSWSLDF
jgi:hypothetical protein